MALPMKPIPGIEQTHMFVCSIPAVRLLFSKSKLTDIINKMHSHFISYVVISDGRGKHRNLFIKMKMTKQQDLQKAYEIGYISEEEKSLIEEYNQRLTENGVPIIYNLRHLRQLLGIRKSSQERLFGAKRFESYRIFHIPKKTGGVRTIEAPSDELKKIQLWIKENILDIFNPSQYAKGFKKGVSIYDNALPHVGKKLVINIDLKDFFPSIGYKEIYKIFRYIGYTDGVSKLLTKLCTNIQDVLPQGSPASPALSNLVSLKLDKRLSRLAKSIDADYTRYADDITFSGDDSISRYVDLIKRIINEEGYEINEGKFRLQYSFQRQEVTGLIVNKKVSVSESKIREIENAIYYCKKYGVINHMKHIGCEKGFYREHLYGLAYFIKMINLNKGEKYLQELDKIDWPI